MVFIWYLHRTQNEGTSAFEPMFLENGFVIYSRKNDFSRVFLCCISFFVYFCRKISNDYEAINFCFMPIMAFCGI